MPVNNSLADAFDELYGLLLDNLGILGLPAEFTEQHIQIPNLMFSTPKNFPWIRITHLPIGRINTDASGCYEINSAYFIISLFWPKSVDYSANDPVTRIAEEIKSLYALYEINDIVVERADLLNINEPSNTPWYGMKVEIYYTYEGLTV